MSSNQSSYPPINRSNYEEHFLLYTDGELSPEGMEAVEAFALLHPDLHEELQLLLETRLDAEPLSFGDLSTLRSDSMRSASREEELLLYMDGELPLSEVRALEEELAANEALRADLGALEAARLPAEAIACPFKEELYRREEKRHVIWWPRAAAAALLLAAAGSYLWMQQPATPGLPPTGEGKIIGKIPPVGTAHKPIVIEAVPPKLIQQDVAVTAKEAPEKMRRAKAAAASSQTDSYSSHATNSVTDPSLAHSSYRGGGSAPLTAPAPAGEGYRLAPDPRDRTIALAAPAATDAASEKIMTGDVTSAALFPYNKQNATEAIPAVYREESRQGSVRGILRKASRFIEKRTGIKTTNEDGQLVLAGVAVNL